MLDIDAILERTKRPVPTRSLPCPDETEDQARSRAVWNMWIKEWEEDRRDLRAALAELKRLREPRLP